MTAINLMMFHRNHVIDTDASHKPMNELDVFDIRRSVATLDILPMTNVFIVHDDINFMFMKNRVSGEKNVVYPLNELHAHLGNTLYKLNDNVDPCNTKVPYMAHYPPFCP